jgi:hypothetical protein
MEVTPFRPFRAAEVDRPSEAVEGVRPLVEEVEDLPS